MDTQFLFRLGDFQARLTPYPRTAQVPVSRFVEQFHPFLARAIDCSKCLHNLIVATVSVDTGAVPPAWLLESQRQDWQAFCQAFAVAYRQFCQARSLRQKTDGNLDVFTFAWFPAVRRNSDEPIRLTGLVVEDCDQYAHLRVFGYLLLLATGWHLQRGGLLIHSSAVAHNERGFLFLGASESGKTTLSTMSDAIGRRVLGDDLNFIICEAEAAKLYRLAAAPSPINSPVGYSMIRPILRGVFTLVKDDRDYLISLSPRQVAHAMFDGFINQTPYTRRLPNEALRLAFRTCVAIARAVPGYELHFRKSPDFWKLIDEQFPD